jgi:hypothetical protein
MTGTDLIAIERHRQITEEGYGPSHDAGQDDELAFAAAAYAIPPDDREMDEQFNAPSLWPWAARYWKPTPDDRVRELVKAGALIAAAIDSLLSPTSEDGPA